MSNVPEDEVLVRRVHTLLRGLVETLDEMNRRDISLGDEAMDWQLFVIMSEARDFLNKSDEEGGW